MEKNYKGLHITLIVLLVILLLVIGGLIYYYSYINSLKQPDDAEEIARQGIEILYHGDTINVSPGIKRYGYSLNINDATILEKYDGKTYHNYENNEYLGESEGKLEKVFENDTGTLYGIVSNVKRIAAFNELNAFPREISKNQDITGEKLKQYDDVYKADLDGDGTVEYVCFKYGEAQAVEEEEINSGVYTKKYVTTVDLLGEKYNLISNLVVFSDYEKENDGDEAIYLTNVDIIDIDGDGILEIFIDLYGNENSGSVAIYKYNDGKVYGTTNYKASTMP